MAFTQVQLDALDDAIASGALTVKYQDKTVTYRSLADMLRLRDLMAAELSGDDANRNIFGGVTTYVKYDKGMG